MTDQDLSNRLRFLYWLTAAFGLIGFVSYFALRDAREAVGFLIGALGSFGNLWLFVWLSRVIAGSKPSEKKPQRGALFIGRYLVLALIGYATVNALGVTPLAVVLGLLASTAAVLTSSLFEIGRTFTRKRSSS